MPNSHEPIFQEIKFRLLNTNTNQVRIYTLQELIATTYRRGQFKYRGRWTGLKDKNGKQRIGVILRDNAPDSKLGSLWAWVKGLVVGN